MHEMAIALQVIDIAAAAIPADEKGVGVKSINLKVGKLSAIVPESLRFCFEIAAKETPVAGAELILEEIPVTLFCRSCRHQWTVSHPAFSCPSCEDGDIEMLSGRELSVDSIEITEDECHVASK